MSRLRHVKRQALIYFLCLTFETVFTMLVVSSGCMMLRHTSPHHLYLIKGVSNQTPIRPLQNPSTMLGEILLLYYFVEHFKFLILFDKPKSIIFHAPTKVNYSEVFNVHTWIKFTAERKNRKRNKH